MPTKVDVRGKPDEMGFLVWARALILVKQTTGDVPSIPNNSRKMTEPVFKKYTDLIDGNVDLTDMMRDQGTEIGSWLAKISEPESMLVHAPYTWTLKEVVNHLSDCERVFSFRALWIARGGTMPLVSFDENEFSLRSRANDFSIEALATEFRAVRQSTVTLFENLPESSWHSVGQVMGFDVTVHKQATILLGHVSHHWRILQQRFGISH